MKREATDEVLAHMDELLADAPVLTCWKCETAPGEPSMCASCRSAYGYERPPKDIKRVPWDVGPAE